MKPVAISDGIFWIGVNDEKTVLFEGLWPIKEEGISYNSYLIKDNKTALVDLCKEVYSAEYLDTLKELIDPTKIDYLVINHMEPDHSGALSAFLVLAPQATILCTIKSKQMLLDFFGITDGIQIVSDNEELPLGNHTLRFITTPMVHWPETMMTYETRTGTLFSCDGFGGYGKLTNGIFDHDYPDKSFYEKESLRYFANIVAAFSKPVLNAGKKLVDLDIRIVAPSHGLIWKEDPGRIISLYLRWSGYSQDKAEKAVTLMKGSMYGNTEKLSRSVEEGLRNTGIALDVFDVTQTHISYILPVLWVNQGVMIGAPTYEGHLFPAMALALEMAEFKRMFGKNAAFFGSYGWGGGAARHLSALLEKLKWSLSDTLEFAGSPTKENLEKAKKFGEDFGKLILSQD